jgi:UDP-N-acetylmuramoylalanine--D-glutamate ligase
MRILGKGKTALAIKNLYPEAILYDDNDIDSFDQNSDELTVVSPGIPPYNRLVTSSENLISEYDLLLDKSIYSIWISGTNGKTTTTSMIGRLLEDDGFKLGGNIGIAVANLIKENYKKLILETSSFTLHYTNQAKPNIYILLPISEDHISWHTTFKDYEQSKLKPLSFLTTEDIAIIPSIYKDIKTKAKVYCYDNSIDLANQFNIDITQINFKEPFLLDAILALVCEKLYKDTISYQKINSFIQDAHKLEQFKDKKNRVWVDDSKATNVDATIQALKTYEDKKIFLILGGDDKGADLKPLFEKLQYYNVEIYSIGSNAKRLKELSASYNIVCVVSDLLENAVASISKSHSFNDQNSVALLSPAAASLDQFSSYKDRGDKFKQFISKIV